MLFAHRGNTSGRFIDCPKVFLPQEPLDAPDIFSICKCHSSALEQARNLFVRLICRTFQAGVALIAPDVPVD